MRRTGDEYGMLDIRESLPRIIRTGYDGVEFEGAE